jgi:hypothetical protein
MTFDDLGYVRVLMEEREREARGRRLARATRPLPCCGGDRLALLRRFGWGRRVAGADC